MADYTQSWCAIGPFARIGQRFRSEEHTSELQSQSNLVCRLLLEKKTNHTTRDLRSPTASNHSPMPAYGSVPHRRVLLSLYSRTAGPDGRPPHGPHARPSASPLTA